MIKNHRKKAIISSVVILLPILFGLIVWSKLPATMVSHWGADGVADGTAPKALLVFGMPLLMLAIHWLCLGLACLDKKSNQYHNKLMILTYSIVPALSVLVNGVMYAVALETDLNLLVLLSVFMGVLFIVLGNYMPKTTRNRHMGIKLRWTMGNDENWQKTHRLGGRLQVVSGILMLFAALLPLKVAVGALVISLVLAVGVPTLYSYLLYRKHRAEGIEYEPVFDNKEDKVALWIARIAVPLILAGVAVLMFTGDISVAFNEADFEITASYMEDISVRYEDIDSVEYWEAFDIGQREMGYGSPKLSMGTFKNDEFGRYTLYAYTSGEGCVVLKREDRVLVIIGKTAEETKAIYETLASKILP